MAEPPETIRQALLQQMESLQVAGVAQLPHATPRERGEAPAPPATTAAPGLPPAEPGLPQAETVSTNPSTTADMPQKPAAASSPTTDQPIVSQASTLQVLEQEVAGCTLCDELASTRTQTVFGVGNPNARLCFLGEAPGADEDRTGEPFVGRAGKLLDKIIEACTLKREEVYILNNLKCRPPGNRNPTPAESCNCSRYLIRQLQLIQPEFICCLGAIAAQNLLATQTPIGRLRGKIHDYRGTKVVCTYHPAYLLRNPSAKKDTWDDMKMLMAELGVKL